MDLKSTTQLAERICTMYGELSLVESMAEGAELRTRSMMNMMLEALDVDSRSILAVYKSFRRGQSCMNRDWTMALLYYRDNGYFKSMFHHIHQQITASTKDLNAAA